MSDFDIRNIPLLTEEDALANQPVEPKTPIGSFSPWESFKAGVSREAMLIPKAAYYNLIEPNQFSYDPNYDMWDDIKDSPFEQFADEFVDVRNQEHATKIKNRILEQHNNLLKMADNPKSAMAGSFVGGVLDVSSLLPVVGVTARIGALAKAGLGAGSAATAVGLSEAAGHTFDTTRTVEESVEAVALSAAVGGLLFGVVGGINNAKLNAIGKKNVEDLMSGKIPEIDVKAETVLQSKADKLKPMFDTSEFKFSDDPTTSKIAGADKGVFGFVLNKTKGFNPVLRGLTKTSAKARELTNSLLSNNFVTEGTLAGKAKPIAIDAEISLYSSKVNPLYEELSNNFVKAKQQTKGLDLDTFKNRVLDGLLDPNTKLTKEEANTVKTIRAGLDDVFQEYKAIHPELEYRKNYIPRGWDLDAIYKNHGEFRARLGAAIKKTTPDISDVDLAKAVDEIDSKVTDPSTSLIQSMSYKPQALKQRQVLVDDIMMRDFLDSDLDRVLSRYYQDAGREISFRKRFGSTDLKEQINDVLDDYNKLIKNIENDSKLSPEMRAKETNKMLKERDEAISDLEATRDILLGKYGRDSGRGGELARKIQKGLLTFNATRLLGMSVVAQLADLSRMIGVAKLSSSRKFMGMLDGLSDLKKVQLSDRDWAILAEGTETFSQNRSTIMYDLQEIQGHNTKFDKWADWTMQKFFKFNLMTPMNDFTRRITITHMSNNIIDDLLAKKAGKLPKSGITNLRKFGIDEAMEEAILKNVKKYASKSEDGVYDLNIADWDSHGTAFMALLKKEVDNIILLPGAGDKPLFMKKGWARLVGQFRGFSSAAFTKALLPNLQDIFVQGGQEGLIASSRMISATMLGAVGYIAREKMRGGDVDYDPKKLLLEGLDRGGAFPVVMDINNITDRFGLGMASAMGVGRASRFANVQFLQSVLGPSAGLTEDLASLANRVSDGDISDSDMRAMIRLMPAYNLLYWHWLTYNIGK